jgi:orotidine-5'-phosphate decarboxylase
MSFVEKLKYIQRKNNSLLCIGLDTDTMKVPASLRTYPDPQFEFNRRIIDATKDLVCAYKLNIAFYESAGEHGWRTIHRTLARIPDGILSIGDAKRGDIPTSAERQAMLLCEDWGFSGTTVNPYMGRDSIEPFMKRRAQCAFILTVTSNRGAKDFQYLKVKGRPLYEHVVSAAKRWNARRNLGLVAGANRPSELKRIRAIAPGMPILIPGVGAQKGSLESAVRYGCDRNGELALINVGRSIVYVSKGKDFAERAREAAQSYRDRINRYRAKYF